MYIGMISLIAVSYTHLYDRYICVLAENKLMEYNSSGKLENEIDLEINNPVDSLNNK